VPKFTGSEYKRIDDFLYSSLHGCKKSLQENSQPNHNPSFAQMCSLENWPRIC